MKKLLLLLLLLPCCASAQYVPIAPITGIINSAGATCTATIMDSTNSGPANCVSRVVPSTGSTASIVLAGTFTATVQFEISADSGRTWVAAPIASATVAGTSNFGMAGYNAVRARASAYTSGTISVVITIGNGAIGSVLTGTVGQPSVYKGTNSTGSSAAYFDATAFAGADPCVADRAAFTAAAQGQLVDGRGFSTTAALVSYGATTFPNIICSVSPIPTSAAGSFLIGPGIYHMQVAFTVPIRVDVTGAGWDTNVSNAGGANGTGIGATVIAGCKSTDSACNSTNFPAAPGGPIVCWGAQGRSGGCDRGGDNPIFDSPIRRVTIDCNAIAGAIGMQDMNAEEGTGGDTIKYENCYNGGWALEIAGGITPAANSVTSISGTTVNGSGFDSSLLFNQVKFSADVACSGGPCNYTIASINAGGTVITLDTSYTGAACAPCSLTISNAAAQNGFFYNLYSVHRVGLTATAAGGAILMNTGSGSNEGPKFIREVTVVNSNATQVTDMIRLSGCCTDVQDIHEESFVNGVSFGKDAVASSFTLMNLWVGSVSAGASSAVAISNTFASANIGLYQLKTIAPNPPTNIIADSIGGNTITVVSEANMSMYVLGSSSGEIVTSSHTVASKFFALQSATTVTLNATSAASGTGIGSVASNTLSLNANGTEQARVTSTGIRIAPSTGYGSSTAIGTANDVALVRAGASIYEISDGGNNANGFLKNLGAVRVTADQTINGSTALTNVTGLSWAIPSTAVLALHFECDILYSQATANVADQFGIQVSATAQSGTVASGEVWTANTSGAVIPGSVAFVTAATPVTIVTFTPTAAVTTIMNAHLAGTIVNAVSTANTVNIMAATSNTSDALIIKNGSGCHAWVTSN